MPNVRWPNLDEGDEFVGFAPTVDAEGMPVLAALTRSGRLFYSTTTSIYWIERSRIQELAHPKPFLGRSTKTDVLGWSHEGN